ncbi:MAG: hypothetical protein ACHQVS_03045 [Candidatus Babeliales bacterium]
MAHTMLRSLCTLVCALLTFSSAHVYGMTSYSRQDPFPIYNTLDPHEFLYTRDKLKFMGLTPDADRSERVNFSVSPFGQNARNAGNHNIFSLATDDSITPNYQTIQLGDIGGRWDMIALLFGPTPTGQTLPPSLLAARQTLFPMVPLGTPIDDTLAIDPSQQFGFFTIPMKYRKRGVRFEFDLQLLCDIGLKLQTGVANIYFAPVNLLNLTPNSTFTPDPTNPNLTKTNVNGTLMQNVQTITNEINFEMCTFDTSSVEDIRATLYWRHAFPINRERKEWPIFLFTPFLFIEGSVAAGKERHYNKAFDISFGSNSHHALGFTGGFDVDFAQSIELGIEGGFDHFFKRDFCNVHIPTSNCQSGIYPFATSASIQPGDNWHFGAKMSAYHFLERLSCYVQYVIIKHKEDKITPKTSDPSFLPELLECKSDFTVQVFNFDLNYDISPDFSLGFLYQLPFKQQRAFNSGTLLFSLNIMY